MYGTQGLGTYPKTGRYNLEKGSTDLFLLFLEKHRENEKIFGPQCRDPLILINLNFIKDQKSNQSVTPTCFNNPL